MLTPHLLKILIYVKFWHVNIFNMFLSVWNCDNYISLACRSVPAYTEQGETKEKWLLLCCVCVSHVQLFATPWTVVRPVPLSMAFSRQEYWSG